MLSAGYLNATLVHRFEDGVLSDGELVLSEVSGVLQSPTGRWMVLNGSAGGPDFLAEVVDGAPGEPYDVPVEAVEYRFTPDESALIAATRRDKDSVEYVAIPLTGDQTPRVLATAENFDFDFRAYNSGITFVERPNYGGKNAFFAPIDGSGPVQLSDIAGGEYIRKGAQLIGSENAATFVASTDGLYELFIADLAGGAARRIHEPQLTDVQPGPVAPDGSAITYIVGDELGLPDNELYLVPVVDGEPGEPLPIGYYNNGDPFWRIVWSPDSRWLSFVNYADDEEVFDLTVVDLDHEVPAPDVVAVLEDPAPNGAPIARFGPLSRGLYYTDDTGTYQVDLSSGTPSGPVLLGEVSRTLDIAADESAVVFTDHEDRVWHTELLPTPTEAVRIDDGTAVDRREPKFSSDGSAAMYLRDGYVTAVGLDTPGHPSSGGPGEMHSLYVLPTR